MRKTMIVVTAALLVALAVPAFAELQNVKVGGELRIRGNYFSPEAAGTIALFEETGNALSFVEQRTRLNVTADFTNDITAFIELDSYDVWGEDFRSDYITGVDSRATTADDVEVYQAYIETRETFGYPVTVRIGRQELSLGNEWLVGNNSTASFFRGLSFDGISIIYTADTWNVGTGWFKLAETSPLEEDGDVDLYGVYGTYTGFEDIVIDAYWLFVRDARGAGPGLPFAFDTSNAGLFPALAGPRVSGRVGDAIEDIFGVDQYSDTSDIHTFGIRTAGTYGNFDFEAEIAYQTGDAVNATRTFFQPDPSSTLTGPTFLPVLGALPVFGGPYAEDDAEYDSVGLNLEVGYSFDTSYHPRVYLGLAWFEGEDEREDTFSDFLRSLFPFYVQDASVGGFNRLFSDVEYSEFLANTDLSNALILRAGGSIQATEAIELSLALSYFQADEETHTNGIFGVPFFSNTHDDEIGWELGLYANYDYSDDLSFEFGYAHFFADDGAEDGNFIAGNGLINVGGSFGTGVLSRIRSIPNGGDDDLDYVYAETQIKF